MSPLRQPGRVPFRPYGSTLAALGRTLVLAPHADDESLGCGGLLALLARRHAEGLAQAPHVLFVTDGTGSHRRSRAFPPKRLRDVREREARAALRRLGLPAGAASFLRLADEAIPAPGHAGFVGARLRMEQLLMRLRPRTLVLPWRRDPHGDHRAAWLLARTAARVLGLGVRLLEYPLWALVRPEAADHPRPGEVRPWRLDVRSVLALKKQAVSEHRSQTTALVHDDPDGFRLTSRLRAHFERPWEIYFDAGPATPPRAQPAPRTRRHFPFADLSRRPSAAP